jgi:hypothetical protein
MRRVLAFALVEDDKGGDDGEGGDDDEMAPNVFTIDEEDYVVLSEMMLEWGVPIDTIEKEAWQIVGFRDDDKGRRVDSLQMPSCCKLSGLPSLATYQFKSDFVSTWADKVQAHTNPGTTTNPDTDDDVDMGTNADPGSIMDLGLEISTSIAPSIGMLQNLEHLDFSNTKNLFELPEEIGNLWNLKTMSLQCSRITCLPPSIGLLLNLKVLNLNETWELCFLPEEIGNLTNLNTLLLSLSKMCYLPPSIGRLQNLHNLDLSYTQVTHLPEEIGKLASLKTLHLNNWNLKCLPPSIGGLQSLRYLDLSDTHSLSKLPEEVGNLTNLRVLDLLSPGNDRSGFEMLPDIVGKIDCQLYLNVPSHMRGEVLLTFVEGFRSLAWLGNEAGHEDMDEDERKKLSLALACNRARSLVLFADQNSPKLWPLILANFQVCHEVFSLRRRDVLPLPCQHSRAGRRQAS